MRLIEVDKLRDDILNDSDYDNDTINHFLYLVDSQPTVDTEPVRHSRWIDVSERLPNEDGEFLEYFPVIVKGIIDGGTHDGEEIICNGFGKYIDYEREWEVETSIDTKIYPREVLAWFMTPDYKPEVQE